MTTKSTIPRSPLQLRDDARRHLTEAYGHLGAGRVRDALREMRKAIAACQELERRVAGVKPT